MCTRRSRDKAKPIVVPELILTMEDAAPVPQGTISNDEAKVIVDVVGGLEVA